MAALLVASTKPAQAAFPGTNGAIAFAGASEQNDIDYRIFRVSPDGKGLKTLATQGFCSSPRWSSNGKKIAYSRTTDDVEGDGEIYLMNADGSGKVNLTKSSDRYEFSPSFYPSGLRIIFTAAPKGNHRATKEAHQQQVPGPLARRLRGRQEDSLRQRQG
jgi:Tol biopolymer transport system component